MKRPTRIGTIVADNPTLGALVHRARQLKSLETLIRSWLPPVLAPHVGLAILRDETLVLTVKSAVWATKLRFEIPALLAEARRHEETREVREIRVRVAVEGDAV